AEGFRVQKETEVPFRGNTMLGVEFYRKDVPFYYDIDELTMKIIDMSEQCSGMYDGWECSLVKI
ncbi:MAG: ribonuclease E inhibitor RraB, partial [Sulfurimonas sp.]